MKHKLLMAGLLLALISFSLSACLFKSSDCTSKEVICVGLVTDTLGLDDHGINQDAWAGLQNATANGSVDQIAYIESTDTRDYEKNIAYFTERGYDAVITTGMGLRDETRKAADHHKDIVFIGINQPPDEKASHPNLIAVTFPEDQMGFVAGVIAAHTTQIGSVGAICETSDIASMWRYCEGFRAGVKFADKNAKALIIYNENKDSEKLFLNETWGYDTSKSLIDRGVDVIFAAGGVTGQGALRAAVEMQVKTIGAERDQAGALGIWAKPWMTTSVYGDAQIEVENVARLLKADNISQLEPSHIKFVPLSPKFPESLAAEINEILIKLWKQEIKTNITTMKP